MSSILHKWKLHRPIFFQAFLELLMCLPILLFIGLSVLSKSFLTWWMLSLPLVFLIGYVFRLSVKGARWKSVVFAIVFGLSLSLIPMSNLVSFCILFILYICITYRGSLYAERDYDELFKIQFLWAGALPVYFVGAFFYQYFDRLKPFSFLVTSAGIAILIITLFLSNSEMLKKASYSKETRPTINKMLKRQNRLYISLTILLIMILTNLSMIKEGLWLLTKMIVKGIVLFVSIFKSEKVEEEKVPEINQPVMPPAEEESRSMFATTLLQIIDYALYGLVILFLVFIGYLLIKKVKLFVRDLYDKFIRLLKRIVTRSEGTDGLNLYTDEKENLVDLKEWKQQWRSQLEKYMSSFLKTRVNWEKLTNNEKVRYVYRQKLKNHRIQSAVTKLSDTPHEKITKLREQYPEEDIGLDKLDRLYGQARYGNVELTEQELKAISSYFHEKNNE
ncbi:hypothetical protein [Bacillus suaedae]|uniref:DUF4129 domain-containing protein n=1 Tax=Halalkalibacter suaedae TaxID=2822140 RepID=A0A941APS7_9BACI|nr:hypothetical protein [Bacillus suaedae]MBP3950428.1 hypothetical protein [Bacillus suaedae]